MVERWLRVSELVDLVEIFDPRVQVCSWQREIDPGIGVYLSDLHGAGELQVIENMSPGAPPRLERLPGGPDKSLLVDDVALLCEIVCELVGCAEAGLRLARLRRAMCPGWHLDHVGIRLVCTYQGPGTQWLDKQDVERSDLRSGKWQDDAFIQAIPGELVLLKGSLWQDNHDAGAIHRSPSIGARGLPRTVITLDPLW